MPTAKIWPKDKLGNEIRKGKMILLKLPEAEAIFYVSEVNPASAIIGADGQAMPVSGDLEIFLKFKLPFHPDESQLHRAVVVEQPEESKSSGIQ